LAAKCVEQAAQHGRHHHQLRDAVAGDLCEHLVGVELVGHDVARAAQVARQQVHAGGVVSGPDVEHRVVDAEAVLHRAKVVRQARLAAFDAVGHALRLAGRARGVGDAQQQVGGHLEARRAVRRAAEQRVVVEHAGVVPADADHVAQRRHERPHLQRDVAELGPAISTEASASLRIAGLLAQRVAGVQGDVGLRRLLGAELALDALAPSC
jgi:hypothetical protein